MTTASRVLASLVSLALLLAAAGCKDTNQPRTGALRLTVVTTGGDLDLNGYVATVEGADPLAVPANGSAVIADLPTGNHSVALTDVATNCTPAVQNPSAVTVAGGDTTNVALVFACVATGVRVTTVTTGIDLDSDGYAVSVDGVLVAVVSANGSVDITRLAIGSHTVALTAVAANCPVTGASSRPVSLVLGEVETVAFNLSCTAVTGVIEVTAATSGVDPDANGYTVQVDGGSPQALAINGTVRFPGLAAGDHSLTFAGAAGNCTVGGTNPRIVPVTTGGATRDTARTTFDVSCVALTGIIEVTAATSGVEPDPDGYTVRVDSGTPRPLAIGGTVRFEGVSGGDHSVAVAGAAANCTIGGENPRTVPVTVGTTTRDTARTTFALTCVSTTGALMVTAATSGAELDPNGYSVYVDEVCDDYYCNYAWTGSVGANDSVTIPGLAVGAHTVLLSDVASNCTLAGANPRTATVPPGDTVELAFAITCVARGSIEVAVTTTGADLDPNGYSVVLNGNVVGTLTVNDTLIIGALLPGNYQLGLQGVAGNCTVGAPNPRTVTVTSGATTPVAFAVTCIALGAIHVTAATTGVDRDPDGYGVLVDGPGGASGTVPANDTIKFSGLPPGDYQLTVNGVAVNCDLSGQNPRPVSVLSGVTTPVTLDVACAQAAQLAVSRSVNGNTDIYTLKENGTGLTRLTTQSGYDHGPAWSPDGTKIAFWSNRDGNDEIYVMNQDGSGVVRLTNSPGVDLRPRWSPDGAKIVFFSGRDGNLEIYVMNADGTSQVRLTNDPGTDADPAWSRDGSKIAFWSSRDPDGEIYVMNADGTGVTQLTTNDVQDIQPEWSPDGSQIVFSRLTGCEYYGGFCDYDLIVMNSDGSGAAQLTSGSSDNDAAWSPDGRWIAFGASFCEYYYYYGYSCYYTYSAVQLVRTDGSRVTELLRDAFYPAWKR
jgi:Tol biopolymer transport system component